MYSLSTCTGEYVGMFNTREEALMYAMCEGLKGEFRIDSLF